MNQASHAAWNSTNANPNTQPQQTGTVSGVSLLSYSQRGCCLTHELLRFSRMVCFALVFCPSDFLSGRYNPSGTFSQNQSTHASSNTVTNTTVPPANVPPPFSSNGVNPDSHPTTSVPNPNGNSNPPPTTTSVLNPPALSSNPTTHLHHPQTPAQQILVSAADRWGLLSLIAMMRNANSDADQGLTSIGTDLGTMGLDMGFPG